MADTTYSIIRIISPATISEEKLKMLAAKFAEKCKIAQYTYRLEVDPSLVGGLVVYAGGFRYDYSIKGQLGRIGTQLKTSKALAGDAKTEEEITRLINETLAGSLDDFKEKPIAAGEENIFNDSVSIKVIEDNRGAIVDKLFQNLSKYDVDAAIDEVGTVISVSDGIAMVSGITQLQKQ